MKCLLTPLLLLLFLGCHQKEIYKPLTEAEIRELLLQDADYLNYTVAMQKLSQGIVDGKWGKIKPERKVDMQEIRKTRRLDEIKEVYMKAGMDEGFHDAFMEVYVAKTKIKARYKVIIKNQPQLFAEVAQENVKPPTADIESIKACYSNQFNN